MKLHKPSLTFIAAHAESEEIRSAAAIALLGLPDSRSIGFLRIESEGAEQAAQRLLDAAPIVCALTLDDLASGAQPGWCAFLRSDLESTAEGDFEVQVLPTREAALALAERGESCIGRLQRRARP